MNHLDAPTIPFEHESELIKNSSSSKTTDSNFVEGSSTDISFDENRTDEYVDLLSIDDVELDSDSVKKKLSFSHVMNDDDRRCQTTTNTNTTTTVDEETCDQRNTGDDTTLSNKENELSTLDDHKDDDDDADDDENDEAVNREFDDYLNDDGGGRDVNKDVNDDEASVSGEEREKLDKLKRLEILECSFENYEELQKMAIEKHGLVNKRMRRRVWPLLILYRNRFKADDSLDRQAVDSSLSIEQMIDSSLRKFQDISMLSIICQMVLMINNNKKLE